MATVDPGTVIEVRACSGCGNPVYVKANKNQIAYYFCTPNDDNNGQGCSHHEKWGRVASNQKLRAYWEARRAHERKGIDDDRKDRLGTGGGSDEAETVTGTDESQLEPVHEPQRPIIAGLADYIRS
ncbi:zinc ribbon domain-containing protein [Terasakiella sp.]|uniref:zinc ribbon domain-containing protein n=1 Tax=Terasakiella sp. TaxID=2034861 RepID=UPI003AA9C509